MHGTETAEVSRMRPMCVCVCGGGGSVYLCQHCIVGHFVFSTWVEVSFHKFSMGPSCITEKPVFQRILVPRGAFGS